MNRILPMGFDVGLAGVAAYFLTRLKKPDSHNVANIFGPMPGSRESESNPEKVVKCIAHRGAGLDVPENTIEAFKYCVENHCNFVELDVRLSRDGKLVVIHDRGLERLTGTTVAEVKTMDWESLRLANIGATHPNREMYKDVHLCLLEEALDFLLTHNCRVIIDVKGVEKEMVEGIIRTFTAKPRLYNMAVVTCFNPLMLYQIRKKDPQIVGAMSYRPYGLSSHDYDAETGPVNPRYGDNLPLQAVSRCGDAVLGSVWRWVARWCGVSAVLLHKDLVSLEEVCYWHSLGIRCAGWCVNRPVEKLYWRGVLKAPYLSKTLVGEPEVETKKDDLLQSESYVRVDRIVDKLLEPERRAASGQR